MMLDALLKLSEDQAVTATAVSTNTIPLSVARDVASGKPLYINIATTEAVTSGSSYTVTFQAVSDTDAALGSPVILSQTGAIPQANLTLGRPVISLPIAPSALVANPKGETYLGLQYTCSGTLSAGKFTAYVSDQCIGQVPYYTSGYSVA